MAYIEDGKVVIHAVHENDLEDVLKSLDLYDEVKNGSGKCYFCEGKVDLKNLAAFIPVQNKNKKEIKYSCNLPQCCRKTYQYADEHDPSA